MMIRLKFERLQRGLSQAALAHLAGVPQPVVCLIETGKWNPTEAQLAALAGALALSPEAALRPVAVVDEGGASEGGRR